MDQAEFAKQEYLALRKEIEESKTRVFQTMGFGLVVVPGSHFIAQKYELDTAILGLPLLVVVVALIYMAESNAIMRCGRYIRLNIEPRARVQGWEAWLERTDSFDRRAVDRSMSYAFYLLFLVYFIGSVFMATRFALGEYGSLWGAAFLGAYFAVGVWFSIFLTQRVKISTSIPADGD